MKATFPADRKGVIEHMRGTFTVDVDVSTADLIAELEKRRPCEKCINKDLSQDYECTPCCGCHYNATKDKFEEAR